jgi:hypothetical protein
MAAFLPKPHPNPSLPRAVKKSRQTIKGMKPGRTDEILTGSDVELLLGSLFA